MPYYSVHHQPHDQKLTGDQQKLKQALIESGEEWSPSWHNLLILDPTYLAAYVKLRMVPVSRRKLSRKVQELVLLAIDASCTHLHDHGIRLHTAAAIRHGATRQEIMEVLELTSVLGVHAVNVGVPLLQEVLAEKGNVLPTSELSDHQQGLKQNFQAQRGYWSSTWDPVLALSPDFFEAYTELSSVPFQKDHSALDAKTKELIYCAIDSATTHLYAPGLKLHIRNAIEHGALAEEVMEVFELAALMGVQTVVKGVDVLADEIGKAEIRK
ncbi:hypothetical protein LTR36_010077 [Oleoguttula mirabilis]|uniref:Carboxymuconolactone decarboxylase-like domain-containing protein n=1 Tax=Oleoguttula mirabilis TaxID=1507867 RepID=A0AAV9JRG7_9PEZI|nr:hypothetical protein LTR36_010077 [Oleoguttula mirabilis]